MKQVPLEREIPPSFADSLTDNYLGNPEVVSELVASYCQQFEDALRQKELGELAPDAFVARLDALVRENAAIFAGDNPEYRIIPGYHDSMLANKLKADLGAFWQKQRARWGDDPVCVLFEWLALVLADKMKQAQGDEVMLQATFGPSMKYAVGVLMGVEARQR